MRVKPDEFYDEMPREQVAARLKELNECDENDGLTKNEKKTEKNGTDTSPANMA